MNDPKDCSLRSPTNGFSTSLYFLVLEEPKVHGPTKICEGSKTDWSWGPYISPVPCLILRLYLPSFLLIFWGLRTVDKKRKELQTKREQMEREEWYRGFNPPKIKQELIKPITCVFTHKSSVRPHYIMDKVL